MTDPEVQLIAEYERGTTPRFYVTPEALGSWADYAQRHVSSDDWEGTLARALLTLVSAYQWARDWPDEQSDGSPGRGDEAVPGSPTLGPELHIDSSGSERTDGD